MDGADWPLFNFHELIMGRPCRCCAVGDLGLLAIRIKAVSVSWRKSLRPASLHRNRLVELPLTAAGVSLSAGAAVRRLSGQRISTVFSRLLGQRAKPRA